LQFNTSFTEPALLVLLATLSLALSCWLARYPRKTSVGVTLGVVLGVFLTSLAVGIVAFLGNVLPFGQIDFWLASSLTGILR
jgi:lipopolysaccharide export LptBFGC system permease protein LptF